MRRSIFLITSFLLFFTSASHAQRKEVKFLSGTDNRNTVDWKFWCTGGRQSGSWSTIAVPSHWEQQGFGAYNYGRDYVTYGKNFRFEEEQGIYKHQFTIPSNWQGKDIFIVFEGSMTDTEVKINGTLAGEIHRGSFYRFKYNISDKINYGKSNQLDVTVSKMSSDASVNNAERLADYWILGGIFRPVYLEAYPKEHIDWFAIDAQADGNFSMNVYLKNSTPGRTVVAELTDSKGKSVGTIKATTSNDTLVKLIAKIQNPSLWTAETPTLYNVKVYLRNRQKNVYETTDKFGFRTIEIRKGDGIYCNGTKIKMKGVNRHVWWPETGRSVNREIDLNDVQLMKEMNMNAVRCSHYPPDHYFLRVCDSLGLYVLDELAGWQKAYSTKAGAPLVKELVMRDVNHPSIVIWSNGNEGGHNKELDDDYGMYDPSNRPVIHAHHRPGNIFNNIDCNHYEDYNSTLKILADSTIYMPTEFLHSQDDGGGGAALADFWELHWNSKRGAGGFLWALVDEGLVRTDFNNSIDVNGVNAPDGLLGPHREKEGSFNAIREIYSPIKISMKELPSDFTGEIAVENRYHFTNTMACTFEWSLVNFKKPDDFTTSLIKLKSGNLAAPSIAPTAKGNLKIELPSNWRNYDALTLTAFDPFKKEIYTWTWKVKSNALLLNSIFSPTGKEATTISETDSTISVKASGITVTFNKKSGMISQLLNDFSAKLSFKNGPILVSGNASFAGFKHFKDGDAYTLEASYTGDLKYVRWKMHASGWLSMEYEYHVTGKFSFTGISFRYPENFVLGAKWLGKGPYRVWKNRMSGTTLGVWENRNNSTDTGSAPWIYPEFKGYYANVTWMEMNTVEGKFIMASNEENCFVRLFDFYGLSGATAHPKLPAGDISFLDNIPPIGTKLALNINYNTSALGPESEPSNVSNPVKRTLYFYFGLSASEGKAKQFTMPKENVLTD